MASPLFKRNGIENGSLNGTGTGTGTGAGAGAGDEITAEFSRPDLPSRCTWTVEKAKNDPTSSPHPRVLRKPVPKVLPNVLSHIGNTPMIRLNKIPQASGLKCDIYAKCEFFNPGGSVKDRIALRMIEDAEESGIIKPGYTLIEATSGNTGIGLAMAAAVKGYRCIIVMAEKSSTEKSDILHALGAEIIRTPTAASFDSPEGFIAVAQRLAKQIPNSFLCGQYHNAGNPLAHYDTTAEEILEQCDGVVDMVVVGAGTGGTVTGIGRKMKERCPSCIVVGVDPEGSILAQSAEPEPEPVKAKFKINDKTSTFYEIEGIGYDFIPTVLDRAVVDKWYKTNDRDSFQTARQLIQEEGLLCGGSCGSAVSCAVRAAKDAGLREGQRVVVILPDGVRNYMTKFLSDDWMAARDFFPMSTFKSKPLAPKIQKEMPSGGARDGDKDKACADELWWWDTPVSKLKLSASTTIPAHAPIKEAIETMTKKGCQQMPVINAEGKLLGMLTLGSLFQRLLSATKKTGINTETERVEVALDRQFYKVGPNCTLRKLSHILNLHQFALVVHEGAEYLNTVQKDDIIGIVTKMNFLDYVSGCKEFQN